MIDMTSVPVLKAAVFKDKRFPSRLIPQEADAFGWAGPYIVPMYDPEVWSNLLTQSSRLRRAIHVFARNTVGLGYRFVQARPDKVLTPAEREQYLREQDDLFELLDDVNPELSFDEVMERFKVDEESTGDGYLEPVRDRFGRVARVYHAPAKTMRVHVDATSYVQYRGTDCTVRYFVPFGDTRSLDPLTGEERGLAWNKRASEIVHHNLYTADDDYYGAPRFVSAAPSIATNRMSQQWNLNLLRNSAHIPFAIITEGANLNSESRQMIEAFVNREGTGSENAGRVLLLEPEMEAVPFRNRDQIRIRLEKLFVGVEDDGSFLKLREATDEEVREVMGIPKMLLGTFTDANKANAVVALRVTVQQEIEPEIRRIEHMLNRTIVKSRGAKFARIAFVRPKILDPLQDASLVQKLMQGLTVNEIRAVLASLTGQAYTPMEDERANTPLAYLPDPKLTQDVEKDVDAIVRRTRELTEKPADVDGKNGRSFLPPDVRGLAGAA